MKCIIRRAAMHDFPAILSLLDQLNDLHVVQLPLHFQKPQDAIYSEDEFNSMLQSDEFIWLVAEKHDGEIAGFLRMELRMTANATVIVRRLYASIEEIFVEPEYRKAGIGFQLVQHAQRLADDAGAEEMCLNVYSFNTDALAFYEKLGFQITSFRMRKPTRNKR